MSLVKGLWSNGDKSKYTTQKCNTLKLWIAYVICSTNTVNHVLGLDNKEFSVPYLGEKFFGGNRDLSAVKIEYGDPNSCMDYDIEHYGMKRSDCLSLSAVLSAAFTLSELNLSSNFITDKKVINIICKYQKFGTFKRNTKLEMPPMSSEMYLKSCVPDHQLYHSTWDDLFRAKFTFAWLDVSFNLAVLMVVGWSGCWDVRLLETRLRSFALEWQQIPPLSRWISHTTLFQMWAVLLCKKFWRLKTLSWCS